MIWPVQLEWVDNKSFILAMNLISSVEVSKLYIYIYLFLAMNLTSSVEVSKLELKKKKNLALNLTSLVGVSHLFWPWIWPFLWVWMNYNIYFDHEFDQFNGSQEVMFSLLEQSVIFSYSHDSDLFSGGEWMIFSLL